MLSFRVTSQRTSSGNKVMGGLRGSSKIGTSNANKRAQSRRSYGGNFFFNMPGPAPTPTPTPAPFYYILDSIIDNDGTNWEGTNSQRLYNLSNLTNTEFINYALSKMENDADMKAMVVNYTANNRESVDYIVGKKNVHVQDKSNTTTGQVVYFESQYLSEARTHWKSQGHDESMIKEYNDYTHPIEYVKMDSGIYLIQWNMDENDTVLESFPGFDKFEVVSATEGLDVDIDVDYIVYNIGDAETILYLNNETKEYTSATADLSASSDQQNMTLKFVVKENVNNKTVYTLITNEDKRASVTIEPNGPPIAEKFNLYSLNEDNTKKYVYLDIDNSGDSSANTPPPQIRMLSEEQSQNFTSDSPLVKAEFQVAYTPQLKYSTENPFPVKYYTVINDEWLVSSNNYLLLKDPTASIVYGIDDVENVDELDNNPSSLGERAAYHDIAFSFPFTDSIGVYKEFHVRKEKVSTQVSGTHSDGYISTRNGSARNAVTGTQLATGFMTDSQGNYSFEMNSTLPELIEITFEGEGTDTLTGETHKTPMSALMTKEDLEASNKKAHITYMSTLLNELTKEEMEIAKADTTLSETEKVAEMKSIELSKQLKMSECFGISLENLKKDPIDTEDIDAISAAQTVHNTIETIARGIENDADLTESTKSTLTRSKIMGSLITIIKDTAGKFPFNTATKIKEIYDDMENVSNVSLTKKDNMSTFMAATNSEIESSSTQGSFNRKAATKISKGSTLRDEMIKEMNKPDNKFKDTNPFDYADFIGMKTDAETNETPMDSIKHRNDKNGNKARYTLVSEEALKTYLLNDVTIASESTVYGKDVSVVDIFAEDQPLDGKTDGDEIDLVKVMIWGKLRGIDLTVDMLLELELIAKVVLDDEFTSTDVMNKLNALFNSDDMADWTMYKVIEKTETNCNVDVEGGSLTDPYYDFKVMKQKTLKFDTRKTYTFWRNNPSHPFYIKDNADTSRIEIFGQGSATSGISQDGIYSQSFTLSFKDTFDISSDSLTYFCTTHNNMNKTWNNRKMYYTSKLANDYTILAKTSDNSQLSQWIYNYNTNKLIRKDYDHYWINHGITLWEDVALEPVIEEVPMDEPVSVQEKIIIKWEELEMQGEIAEIVFPEGRFDVDMYNSAYGNKRGEPIKIHAHVNGEQKEYVYIKGKFQELTEKYESDKSKTHWNDNGTKIPNDIPEVTYTGVVTKVELEGGYWVVMPDSSIIPGENSPQQMFIMNWGEYMDKQVEGTRVTGVALLLRNRPSFMMNVTFVHAKTMDYEASTN